MQSILKQIVNDLLSLIYFLVVLGDEKKLQVTLNVFKNLNGGDTFEEQKLMNDLKELETRMSSKEKDKFLDQKPVKSNFISTPILNILYVYLKFF